MIHLFLLSVLLMAGAAVGLIFDKHEGRVILLALVFGLAAGAAAQLVWF